MRYMREVWARANLRERVPWHLRHWRFLIGQRILALRRRFGGDSFELDLAIHDPIAESRHPGSDTILVAFGGLAGEMGVPPFEFFKLASDLPVSKLFVRDLEKAWYHLGVPDHGKDIPAVAASLRELIGGAERVVMTGNSAGGYAAILFGMLLEVDQVLAFAPQTMISPEALARMGDRRWDYRIEEVGDELDPAFSDLASLLPVNQGQTTYDIYYDRDCELDRIHAERLEGVPGITLCPRAGGDHEIAKAMRDRGELREVVLGALAGEMVP